MRLPSECFNMCMAEDSGLEARLGIYMPLLPVNSSRPFSLYDVLVFSTSQITTKNSDRVRSLPELECLIYLSYLGEGGPQNLYILTIQSCNAEQKGKAETRGSKRVALSPKVPVTVDILTEDPDAEYSLVQCQEGVKQLWVVRRGEHGQLAVGRAGITKVKEMLEASAPAASVSTRRLAWKAREIRPPLTHLACPSLLCHRTTKASVCMCHVPRHPQVPLRAGY